MNNNAIPDVRLSRQLKRCLFGITVIAAIHLSQAAPGDLDPGFAGPSMDGSVQAIALQSDGKILICGSFRNVGGSSRNWFARLNSDGSLDQSFLFGLSGPDGAVDAVTVQADGKILIGGGFSTVNGVSRAKLARLNSDGSVDTSFLSGMSGPSSTVHCLGVLSDGKMYIGGDFYAVNGVVRTNLARLNSDGSVDLSFGHVPPASSLIRLPNYYSYVWPMALQQDGKVIAWRSVMNHYGDWHGNDYQLARFNSDATLDVEFPYFSLFGWNAHPGVASIVVQNDGKILVGGRFDVPGTNIIRLQISGAQDYSFSPAMNGTVRAIALQEDDKIIVCGSFTMVNGLPHNYIVRLRVDGSVDTSFIAGLDGGFANSLAVQSDHKVILGGTFTSVNGAPSSSLARLMTSDIPPGILASPPTRTCEEGTPMDFFIEAVGYPTPNCQWFFNDRPLSSGTSTLLRLPNAAGSNSGTYIAVLTNVAGAITSTPAMLNVIPPVPRKPVLALQMRAETGSQLNLEYNEAPIGSATWLPLGTVMQDTPVEFWFDVAGPVSVQRFYRAWQTGTPSMIPSLRLDIVPAITLAGDIGATLRLDRINAIGPTNDWVTLATVSLTNTSQLYFDVSSIDQPRRLYRITPVP